MVLSTDMHGCETEYEHAYMQSVRVSVAEPEAGASMNAVYPIPPHFRNVNVQNCFY